MEEDRKTWENLRKKLIKEVEEDKERIMSQMVRERSELVEQITRLNTELKETDQKQHQEVEQIKNKLKTEYEVSSLFNNFYNRSLVATHYLRFVWQDSLLLLLLFLV